MAPEVFENKDYTIKADVYSFAVIKTKENLIKEIGCNV